MRFHAAIVFLAAGFCCVFTETASDFEERLAGKPKCPRQYPPTYGSCTYFCSGWPFRFENEPDGTPCGVFPNGVCVNGRCVDGDLYRSTDSVTPSEITLTSSYRNTPTMSNLDVSTGAPSIHIQQSRSTTNSDEQSSPKPEASSTTHKSWIASRQATSQPFLTTQLYSAGPPFATTYNARSTTLKNQISSSEGSTSISIVSEGSVSRISNKATQPSSSTTRIRAITANRNPLAASEDASASPSFNPSTQNASDRPSYEGKHTERPTRTEDFSRHPSSTLSSHQTTFLMPATTPPRTAHVTEKATEEERSSASRSTFTEHVTTPAVPASTASSTILADASPRMMRNITPGVTVTGSHLTDKPTRTSTPPTADATFTSMRYGGTPASQDTDPAATAISHEDISDRGLTAIGSDLGTTIRSTRYESAEISAGPGLTASTKKDFVTETTGGSDETTENGSIPPATMSDTTPSVQSVATLPTRDPSSFELSIEIRVKGRIPFLKP